MSATLHYPIAGYESFKSPPYYRMPPVCTESSGRKATRNQPFEWICNFLEQFVMTMDNANPDKKIMQEILEAHQFTQMHFQDLNLTQKLFERHSQGKLVIIPEAGWEEHVVGLAIKGKNIFTGNRGGKIDNEPYGACQYSAKQNQPKDMLELIANAQKHSHPNLSISLKEERFQFKQAMSRMVDFSKPEIVAPAKRQKHDTCFLVNHLINIQILLNHLGSKSPHERYKELTRKFKDYAVQRIVKAFIEAKQADHQAVLNILKNFARKILVEHYNIKKSEDQETLRATELLKMFDSKEQKEFIEQVGQEIKEKWILLRIFEKDRKNMCELLKEYDRSLGATFYPIDENSDLDGFAIRLNYLPDQQFSALFDRIIRPTSRPDNQWLVYSEHAKIACSPETIQGIIEQAEIYFRENVAPFFAKAQSPEVQQKILRFSKPTDRFKPQGCDEEERHLVVHQRV